MTGDSLVASDVSVSKFENPRQYVRLTLCGSKTWFVDQPKYCKSLPKLEFSDYKIQYLQVTIKQAWTFPVEQSSFCSEQPQGHLFCSHVLCVLFKVTPVDFQTTVDHLTILMSKVVVTSCWQSWARDTVPCVGQVWVVMLIKLLC